MTIVLKHNIKFWILAISLVMTAFNPSQGQVKPIDIHQLDSIMQVEPKPVLILLSTTWCQYCQMQKQQIRKNKTFKKNQSLFYYVEFDAESKESILFNGKAYNYQPRGANIGTHELSFALNGSDKLVYPTWVLLNEQYQPQFRNQGLLVPKQVGELLEALREYQQ